MAEAGTSELERDGGMSTGDGCKGTNRVLRGGSWINNARNCRSAYRNNNEPGNRNDNTGLRFVREQRGLDGPFFDPTVILSVGFLQRQKVIVSRYVSRPD